MDSKVIFFGGAFDPVHEGHLAMARKAILMITPDVLYFVPLANAVHKGHPLLAVPERLARLRKAISKIAKAEIYTKELERGGKSYTVDTLSDFLASQSGFPEVYFVMGSDEYLDFWGWREPQKILEMCKIMVFSRDGFSSVGNLPPAKFQDRFIFIDDFDYPDSSTSIRKKLLRP